MSECEARLTSAIIEGNFCVAVGDVIEDRGKVMGKALGLD